MVFFCLGLSKKRPRGQLSSSPDFEVGKGRESSNSPGESDGGPEGVPSPVLSTGFQNPLLWGSELEGLF